MKTLAPRDGQVWWAVNFLQQHIKPAPPLCVISILKSVQKALI